jgi:hypothetical protein
MRPRGTFSAGVALPEARLPEESQRELTRGTTGVDLELDGVSVRAGDLPLHRRAGDGGLRQCLRLVVRASDDRGTARVEVLAAGRVLDSADVRIVRGETAVRLFVPEVNVPEPALLRIEGEDGLRLERELEIRPQRKWRVFVIHHSHLDIGYTDPQARVLGHHLSYLDSVLDLTDESDGWPDAARFRWNVEATWPLERWLSARPAAAQKQFFERVREGRIEISALPFTTHSEALSIDELAHQLLFADELRTRYDVSIVTAMQTDVPGAVAGLPGLLADAGVRYLDVAHNWAGRSAPYLNGGQELPRPFGWRSESGKRVLVWYTDSPHGIAYMEGNLLGLADSYESSLALLPEYLAALASRPYPYGQGSAILGPPEDVELVREPYAHDLLHLRLQGLQSDNAPPSLAPAEIARTWNEQWAFPTIRVATNREFFEAMEERLGEEIDTYSGDWSDWWADGLGSAARPLALNRRAQANVRTGQTLHALADQLDEELRDDWPAEAKRTYEDMALFDEHTWGAAHPDGDDLTGRASGALQWQAKSGSAAGACDRSEALVESAATRFAHLVGTPEGALATLFVFNPSPWPRSDLVRVLVPSSRPAARGSFALVDETTGSRIPHVADREDAWSSRNRPQGTQLSFVARDVPAVGYRCYTLADASTEDVPDQAAEPFALENEHYRVEVDSAEGYVARLVDKQLSLDLADGESPFGFNAYVYDRYTSGLRATQRLPATSARGVAGTKQSASRVAREAAVLLGQRTTAGYGVVTSRASNVLEDRISLRLAADGIEWLETSYRLLRGVRRIDIVNRLMKVATATKEGVYFAFPFALRDPVVSYELTGAVGGPGAPRVPGSATHMRAVRHWVALEDDEATVAWATREAPLVELGSIFLPYPPFPETVDARAASVFSWVMNNVWDTNFPLEQAGEAAFAYSVSSGPPGANARELGVCTGAGVAQPLVGVLGDRRATGRLAASGSFCTVDRGDVEIVAITASRSDHDLVVFLQSYAADEVEVSVAFPDLRVATLWAGTFLERDLRQVGADGEARLRVGPGDYVALAVDLERR